MVTGAPGSGLKLVGQCLEIIGSEPLYSPSCLSPEAINRLLIDELALSHPYADVLPNGWRYANCTRQAGNRIRELIRSTAARDRPTHLIDPLLCRTLPIWETSLKEAGIEAEYVHIFRHPAEIAQAWTMRERIDASTALPIWKRLIASIQTAHPDYLYIDFDALLHNPVKVLAGLKVSFLDYGARQRLLYHIQPRLRTFSAEANPSFKLDGLADCIKLFDSLRHGEPDMGSLFADSNVQAAPKPTCVALQSVQHSDDQHTPPALLERKPVKRFRYRIYETNKPVLDYSDVRLSATQWQQLKFNTSESAALLNGSLEIDAQEEFSLVEVATIRISNPADRKVLWQADKESGFNGLEFDGNVLPFPHDDALLLLFSKGRSQLRFPIDDTGIDCPREVEFSLRASLHWEKFKRENFVILNRRDSSFRELLQDEALLDNDGLERWLQPIWPESKGNSTNPTFSYLIRNREKFEKAKAFSARASYKLPSFLVSFPRSGSNMIQNVLESSSGMRCCSLYSPRPLDPASVLSFKSHALSPAYLTDEIARFYPELESPDKTILLQRDPRDVIVSFFEYVKTQKSINLNQSEFLHGISYEYAFNNNPSTVQSHLRKVAIEPLSVSQGYRMHLQSWFLNHGDDPRILKVTYEGLVNDPQTAFAEVFDFLEIENQINLDAMEKKVSQYSSEERPRGVAHGWKKNSTHRQLIEQTEEAFKDLIPTLGYSLSQ